MLFSPLLAGTINRGANRQQLGTLSAEQAHSLFGAAQAPGALPLALPLLSRWALQLLRRRQMSSAAAAAAPSSAPAAEEDEQRLLHAAVTWTVEQLHGASMGLAPPIYMSACVLFLGTSFGRYGSLHACIMAAPVPIWCIHDISHSWQHAEQWTDRAWPAVHH